MSAAFLLLFASTIVAKSTNSAGAIPVARAEDAATVGYIELPATELAMGKPVRAAVWYPAAGAVASPVRRRYVVMDVAEDAPAAPGRYGLIIISHGSGGTHLGHRDIGLALARRGYVVAAPLHTGDNALDASGAGTAMVLAGRAREVSELIDSLLSNLKLAPVIDRERIGVVGFSAGGATALGLTGALPTAAAAVAHCREHAQDALCKRYGTGRAVVGAEALTPGLADARIKAAVAMAPVTTWFDQDAFANVSIPVRLYRAEKDEELSEPWHTERIAALLPRVDATIVLPDAGHLAFLSPVPADAWARSGLPAPTASSINWQALHARLHEELTAFFDRTLPAF